MSEAFLRQLLRVENSVQEQPNSCFICYTEYGTLCEKTGTVEVAIRLPCKHIVGSRCIATWLDPTGGASNSCPVCRHKFFPAQPRPYLEHGIIEDDDVIGDDGVIGDDEGIRLDTPKDFRGYVVNDTWDLRGLRGENVTQNDRRRENAGAESVDEAADQEGISDEDTIPGSPMHIGSLRRSARLRGVVLESRVQNNTPERSARQQGIAQNVDDEMVLEKDTEEDESNLEIIKTMCETYCYRLSLTTNSRAIELSQRIAQHILEDTGVAYRPGDFSMASIAAVSVFATSHLIGAPKTQEWVSINSSIPANFIAGLYWYVTHPHDFGELIDEEMLAMIGRGDRETVLGFLPEAR